MDAEWMKAELRRLYEDRERLRAGLEAAERLVARYQAETQRLERLEAAALSVGPGDYMAAKELAARREVAARAAAAFRAEWDSKVGT